MTHSRYTVKPTAAPISAALNAVEITEPVRPLRRLAGGRSASGNMVNINDHNENKKRNYLTIYKRGSRQGAPEVTKC